MKIVSRTRVYALRVMALASLAVASVSAQAAVLRIDESAFVAGSGLITFSEKPIGTIDPVYVPGDYGGGAGSPTVSFSGYFTGQAIGTVATCPPGAATTGCVVGSPTGPLSLDSASPDAFITTDGAFPTSPTLSGSPQFNGPIALLFDVDVAGVGLEAGFFDAVGGTAITAYDRAGNILGSVQNVGTGIEFLGLVTDDGSAQIAGLLFSLIGPEPAGFNIDNVRFGIAGQVIPPVPEPAAFALLGLGVLGVVVARRRAA